ncbi:WD40/YVTN/BNR-like repeat-containing protein [Spirochaeta isovalerica]|uniref:Photosystem II stability/assembly factor-like uncharacterized protein n=1 Tax=Spirochaeta isovalerica TaxID=150 RepID=A0A841RBK9_9SPIO|nr:hypothetical protein [Spirochaeta isovalerica]MBB6480741.1 photosystem II stability/assembly factor-like uncharacterized protein [Spirochaeta isovalerica]
MKSISSVIPLLLLLGILFLSCDIETPDLSNPYVINGNKSLVNAITPEADGGFNIMAFSSYGNIVLAGAAHSFLYLSENGGEDWYTVNGLEKQEYWTGVGVSENGEYLYVAGQDLYISSDSGKTWRVYDYGEGYDGDANIQLSNDGSTLLTMGVHRVDEVNFSTDYGYTWTDKILGGGNLDSIGVSSNGRIMAALTYSGPLWLSSNSGALWNEISLENRQWEDMALSADGEHIVIAEFGGLIDPLSPGISYSEDSGTTWEYNTITALSRITDVCIFDDGDIIIASGNLIDEPIVISDDQGESWTQIDKPETENPSGWPEYEIFYSETGTDIWALEKGYSLWHSTDGGSSWTKELQGN